MKKKTCFIFRRKLCGQRKSCFDTFASSLFVCPTKCCHHFTVPKQEFNMPVISTRYSTTTTGNSYITPSVGTYRSTLSATSRSSADRASSIERPNYTSATESYINRSRATTSTFRLTSSSSYRLTNGTSSSTNDSYSSRYGVSKFIFFSSFHTPARIIMWFIGSKQQYYSKVFAKIKKTLTQDDVKVVRESEPISFRFAKNVPLLSQSIKFICNHRHQKKNIIHYPTASIIFISAERCHKWFRTL